MLKEDEAGEALRDVARIHRAVDRLRDLLASATFLDMKATTDGYWATHRENGGQALPSEAAAS